MIRKILTLLLFLGLLFVLYVTVFKDLAKPYEQEITIEQLVPSQTSLIIHFNDFSKALNQFESKSYANAFDNLDFFQETSEEIKLIESLFGSNHLKDIYVSIHNIQDQTLDFIWYLPHINLLKSKGLAAVTSDIENMEVSKYFDENLNKEVFFIEYSNFTVMTCNSLLKDKIVESVMSGSAKKQDKDLLSFLNNERNSTITAFINFKRLPKVAQHIFAFKEQKSIDLATIGNWAALEVQFDQKAAHLTGYSSYNDHSNQWLFEQSSCPPQLFEADKIMPSNTIAFLWSADTIMYIDSLALKLDHESVIGFTDKFSETGSNGRFSILRFTDTDRFNKILLDQKLEFNVVQNHRVYSLNNKLSMQKYRPRVFKNSTSLYVAEINQYFVFAPSLSTLEDILYHFDNGYLLSKSLDYVKFKGHLSSKANIIYYQSNTAAYDYIYSCLNPSLKKDFNRYFDSFKHFRTFGFEFTKSGDKFFTNFTALYKSMPEKKNTLMWSADIGKPCKGSVSFVKNYKTNTHQIIVQDLDNKIYLLDMDGNIKWKAKLDGTIQGRIQEIDLYANGKLQYIFNTENKIYCIDRNGNLAEHFPINLSSKITGELAVIDYDKDKNYRFFVSCKNGKVYGFNKSGRSLGYNWPKKIGVMKKPIRYFSSKGKDYLIAINTDGVLYLLNRKGQSRIKPINLGNRILSKPYVVFKDQANIVLGNTNNELLYVGLNRQIEKIQLNDSGVQELQDIIFSDFDEYPGKELLTVENYALSYLRNDSVVFRYKTASKIDPNVNIEYDYLNKESIIAFAVPAIDEIFLINQYGYLREGFPIKGSKDFDLLIDSSAEKFLATYDSNGKIFLYKVN